MYMYISWFSHHSSQVSKGWEKLQRKLNEREESLASVHELSSKYYASLQQPMEWLPDAMTEYEALTAAPNATSATPEAIAQQKTHLMVRVESVKELQKKSFVIAKQRINDTLILVLRCISLSQTCRIIVYVVVSIVNQWMIMPDITNYNIIWKRHAYWINQ